MTGIAKGTMDAQSVELRVAQRDDAATLDNLLQLYLHDLSAFGLWSIGDDGRFAYPHLPRYWSEEGEAEGRAPFIFFAEGELAGFALKNCFSHLGQSEPVSSIAEFFVLRKWRGQGVGRAAAFALFDRFAGRWEVTQLRANEPAHRFWLRAIGAYTDRRFVDREIKTERGDRYVQSFESGAGKHP